MNEQKTQFWRISPGQGGFLWREQKLNNCIAIGWSEIDDAKNSDKEKLRQSLRKKMKYKKGEANYAAGQLDAFINKVSVGDKVIASTSGKGIYAVGTIIGEYKFNGELEYKHSREVQWETTFWHPVEINSCEFPKSLYNKFHGRSSQTIRYLEEDEWEEFCDWLNGVHTPFRNLGMWGGMVQAPEYENEVMILFSHMLQHFNMRIIQFGTRFPDAIVERKEDNKWGKINVEFELRSSGFQTHLRDCKKNEKYVIVCWENDKWRDGRQKGCFEIIELKEHLIKIL